MSEEQAFLETLAAHPGDDVTRLVYADWLDERGDPRGRYLRLEIELAGAAEDDERVGQLEAELRQLRGDFSTEWADVAGKRWDVWLLAYLPYRKISVIKVIRELTGCGLVEGKRASDEIPALVCPNRWRSEAEAHAAQLREAAYLPADAPPIGAFHQNPPGPARERCVVLRATLNPGRRPGEVSPWPFPVPPGPGPFSVYLLSYPAHLKISTIKAIREATGTGLVEAKALSEASWPALLCAGASQEQVALFQRAFAGVGEIEVRPRGT
jgi:uncharacterized protein (TIGR02996 family)